MTLSIPQDKLRDIQLELARSHQLAWVTRRQVQRLAGMLSFASSFIKPGRIYFSRILSFLREMKGGKKKKLTSDILKDTEWWKVCASEFNGMSLIHNQHWDRPDAVCSTDTCLTGGRWNVQE